MKMRCELVHIEIIVDVGNEAKTSTFAITKYFAMLYLHSWSSIHTNS